MRNIFFPDARHALATRGTITCTPVPVYDDESNIVKGKQRENAAGQPLWDVSGVSPILGGGLVEGGKVRVTQEFKAFATHIGAPFEMQGDVETKVYAFGSQIGCSMTGAKLVALDGSAKNG